MNRNSNGMSTGMAILCTLGILLFIGLMIDLGTPKCIKSGCDNDAKEGSSYCYLHDNSTYRYKSSTSYSGRSNSSSSSSTTKSSNTSSDEKSSGTTSNSKKTYSSGSSSSKKNQSSMDSYDDTMRFMKMMITTGIATRAMMTMLPVWMMPWKMRIASVVLAT